MSKTHNADEFHHFPLSCFFAALQRTPSIRADLLQRIHVLHNLAQLVGGPVPSSTTAAGVAVVCHSHGGLNAGASHALRDSGLWQEAGTLKAEYLAQHQARLASARVSWGTWDGWRPVCVAFLTNNLCVVACAFAYVRTAAAI